MHNQQIQPDSDGSPVHSLPPSQIVQTPEGTVAVVIAEDDPVSRKLVTAVVENGGFRTLVSQQR
jgi:uncharacterized membrane protein